MQNGEVLDCEIHKVIALVFAAIAPFQGPLFASVPEDTKKISSGFAFQQRRHRRAGGGKHMARAFCPLGFGQRILKFVAQIGPHLVDNFGKRSAENALLK